MVSVSRRRLLAAPAALAVAALGRELVPLWARPSDFAVDYLAATETPSYDQAFAVAADRLSIRPGEELVVRGRGPGRSTTSIHRVGWTDDGSLPRAMVTQRADLRPESASSDTGEWPVAARTLVTDRWRSGLYVAVTRSDDGRQQRIAPFVVRAPRPSAPIVVQIPFTTYHAYNAWGGASLYPFNSPHGTVATLATHRPFDGFDGAGFLFYGDWHLARWLDRENYEVEYITSYDLHHDAGHLGQAALFLSSFHDEYWSTPMRDHLDAHIHRGGNAAFLAANSIYWRVRLDGTTMTCHKASDRSEDPHPDITATWRSRLVGRPEHLVLGSHYGSYEFPYGQGHDWVVSDETHWCYESTGLRNGDRIVSIIGYEWDHCPDTKADDVSVIASSRFEDRAGDPQRHDATVRTHPGGGTVVNVGTTYWPRLLTGDRTFRCDPNVVQITRNILKRLGARP